MKHNRLKCLVVALMLTVGAACCSSASPRAVAADDTGRKQHMELLKLTREIEKITAEKERLTGTWNRVMDLAPFLTSIVALLGVFITLWKHLSEQSRQRDLDRKQLEAERIRRFDEKFTEVIVNLGSTSPSLQASAAVSVLTFLKPEYAEFHDQVFMLLLANLKVPGSDVVRRLLVSGFEKAVRLKAERVAVENERIAQNEDKIVLDLSGCFLDNADLSQVNLSWANLRKASLQHADLRESFFMRVRGEGADLSHARATGIIMRKARFVGAKFPRAILRAADLQWVHLEEADLSGCQFQQAHLQAAHMENANLKGAGFEQADVNNAFFTGADLDMAAKTSIVKAYNWRLAHFDGEVFKELEAIECRLQAGHGQHAD